MYAYMVVLVVVEGRMGRSEGEDLRWKRETELKMRDKTKRWVNHQDNPDERG